MAASDQFGKRITFFQENQEVSGIIKGFKIPGFITKIDTPKAFKGQTVKVPALALKYCKVEEED